LCSNFYLWPNKEIGVICSKFEIKWKVWKIVLGVVSPRKGTCGFVWAFTLYLEKRKKGGCVKIPIRRDWRCEAKLSCATKSELKNQ
jgi:hypothetical protein